MNSSRFSCVRTSHIAHRTFLHLSYFIHIHSFRFRFGTLLMNKSVFDVTFSHTWQMPRRSLCRPYAVDALATERVRPNMIFFWIGVYGVDGGDDGNDVGMSYAECVWFYYAHPNKMVKHVFSCSTIPHYLPETDLNRTNGDSDFSTCP